MADVTLDRLLEEPEPDGAGDPPHLGAFPATIIQCGDPDRLSTTKIQLALAMINQAPKNPFAKADAPLLKHAKREITIYVGTVDEVEAYMDEHKITHHRGVLGSGNGHAQKTYARSSPGAEENAIRIEPYANWMEHETGGFWTGGTQKSDVAIGANLRQLGLLIAHEATHTLAEATHRARVDKNPASAATIQARIDALGLRDVELGQLKEPLWLAYERPVMDGGTGDGGYNAREALRDLIEKMLELGIHASWIEAITKDIFDFQIQFTCGLDGRPKYD
jgi:hypothetical protein